MTATLVTAIDRDGFYVCRNLISPESIQQLRLSIGAALRKEGRTFASRNLLSLVPGVLELCGLENLRRVVKPILGPRPRAVRGIFFDKTPDANWQLGWHQDRVIAVRDRHEVSGFGAWSRKAGVWHVFPPPALFQQMLTVRVHLDPADANHGALRVFPGTHRVLMTEEEIEAKAAGDDGQLCEVQAGDAVVMRPLLAHASGRCEVPLHRRVVHLEFAGEDLPEPLEWNEALPL